MNNESIQNDIEQQLGDVLHPVTPEKEFISSLQDKLKASANIVVENPNYFVIVLLIVSGLFIGVVVLWVLKKIFDLSRRHE